MARSMLSSGMFSALAASIAVRSRALPSGSPPPCFAAMVISRISLVKSAPRRASVTAFLRLICFHLLWPAMGAPVAGYTLHVPRPGALKNVAAWYRVNLKLNDWDMKGDQLMADGSIALYAVRRGKPLWISLRRNNGGPGTTYTLVGTLPTADSARAQRSGSSMSSNRIQRRQK